ncbi:hypothetical protein KFE98_19630 [bacterium SCSIO 12741]|nr:hypothetical protein KFE98_19630 [bacterium SCSIO 12741]
MFDTGIRIEKSICFDWYDGQPTEGYLEIPSTRECYHFQFLGWGHKDLAAMPEFSVYKFLKLKGMDFQKIEKPFLEFENSNYPIWKIRSWHSSEGSGQVLENHLGSLKDMTTPENNENELLVGVMLPEFEIKKVQILSEIDHKGDDYSWWW